MQTKPLRNKLHAGEGDKTDIPERLVNYVTHFSDPPFDDVAEVFVIDVIVLLSDTPLSSFFQLILTISILILLLLEMVLKEWKRTYTVTSESFESTAITLLSSFG
jgi:hypothetical protein